MRRRLRVLIILVAAGLVMLNFQSVMRGLTTNQAKLSPDADDPFLRVPTLASAPADVADRIESWAAAKSLWAVVDRRENGGTIELDLTRTTRLFRFVDDIQVRLVPTDDSGSRLEASSESRVGKGDLGQNPRNLRELVAAVSQ